MHAHIFNNKGRGAGLTTQRPTMSLMAEDNMNQLAHQNDGGYERARAESRSSSKKRSWKAKTFEKFESKMSIPSPNARSNASGPSEVTPPS